MTTGSNPVLTTNKRIYKLKQMNLYYPDIKIEDYKPKSKKKRKKLKKIKKLKKLIKFHKKICLKILKKLK